MIHRTNMPTLEQVYGLSEDSRYLDERDPDHEAYNAMTNRLQAFHLRPEKWPQPEPFRIGRPLAPKLPVGAGGVNHPEDVAELSDGLLSLGGLGRPVGLAAADPCAELEAQRRHRRVPKAERPQARRVGQP